MTKNRDKRRILLLKHNEERSGIIRGKYLSLTFDELDSWILVFDDIVTKVLDF